MDPRDIGTLPPDNTQDPWLYRILVGGLLLIIMVVVIGALVLAGRGVISENAVTAVITIAAAIAGYLGGLLTPKPQQ
jgi:hypothetical protein